MATKKKSKKAVSKVPKKATPKKAATKKAAAFNITKSADGLLSTTVHFAPESELALASGGCFVQERRPNGSFRNVRGPFTTLEEADAKKREYDQEHPEAVTRIECGQ